MPEPARFTISWDADAYPSPAYRVSIANLEGLAFPLEVVPAEDYDRERAAANRVYAVIATAVYDHGIVGVYSTRESAENAAEDQWRNSDGHHRFRVEELGVDVTYAAPFPRFWITERLTDAEPEVEFLSRREDPDA